jgi:hypothetical protein
MNLGAPPGAYWLIVPEGMQCRTGTAAFMFFSNGFKTVVSETRRGCFVTS